LTGFQTLSGSTTTTSSSHSRFFDEDRKRKRRYKTTIGNKNEGKCHSDFNASDKAGMDISCETMHLKISPINSFYNAPGVVPVGKANSEKYWCMIF
jgi:CRISPR-associated endonuclease/helicase Cas3